MGPGGVVWWKNSTPKISCYSPFKGPIGRILWAIFDFYQKIYSEDNKSFINYTILHKPSIFNRGVPCEKDDSSTFSTKRYSVLTVPYPTVLAKSPMLKSPSIVHLMFFSGSGGYGRKGVGALVREVAESICAGGRCSEVVTLFSNYFRYAEILRTFSLFRGSTS